MRKIYLVSLLSIFSLNLYCQIKWEKHPDPVMETVPAGSWDDLCFAPCVLFYDTTYHMWYSGYDGTNTRIGYATSPDGITWTKNANPVLKLGSAGNWDDDRVYLPSVVLDGSTFHMWYTGNDGSTERIGYATSPDGITWTKNVNNPVMDLGPTSHWDDELVGTPFVLFADSTYQLWYTGSGNLTNFRIGHATSPDGINWTKDAGLVLPTGSSGSWDYPRVQDPRVIFDGTIYHMWYSGGKFLKWQIGHATSPDGISWTKNINNPVLDLGPAGSWDDDHVSSCWVLFDTATYTFKMWYSGAAERLTGSIGYAESDSTTIIREISDGLVKSYTLKQNYPNPFASSTTIEFSLPRTEFATLKIYNIIGQELTALVSEKLSAGTHEYVWNASGFVSGIYFYKLETGSGKVLIRKLDLIK